MPRWGRILLLYAGSRVVSTAFLLAMFWLASVHGWTFASHRADPTFFTFSGSWDASFYKRIAETGYPSTIPTDAAGTTLTNPWAFLPVFPYLARGLMLVTGLGFYPAAVIIATVAGGAAALALDALLRARVSERQAMWAVVFFSFGPMSFLLQTAYAESLALALTFAALWALVRQHYLVMIPLGVAAAFTRPGALALAAALLVHLIVRLVTGKPFLWRERVAVVVAGLAIAAAGSAWPFVASAVTGDPTAYVDTELAWWTPLVGAQHFVPFTPWFLLAGRYLGVLGIVLVVVVMAAVVWLLTRRSARALGHEIVAFAASYGAYLFAVFLPQQSILRLALPLSPLLGADALSSSPRRRWSLFAAGLALQPVAIVFLWFLGFP